MAVTINGTTGIESPALDASGTVTADAVVIDALGGTLSFTGGGTTAINAQSSPLIFQTSGTERGRFTGGGDFQFNSGYGSAATAYGCRAWVNFDGTTATPSIRASGNVSSISDQGVGRYSVNFVTSMPDTNYSTVSTDAGWGNVHLNTFSLGAVEIRSRDNSFAVADYSIECLAVFR